MSRIPVASLWLLALLGWPGLSQTSDRLTGTEPLTWQDDLSVKMMDGAHRFVERKIDESVNARRRHWRRDISSPEAYERSVAPNRERFQKIIGLADSRVSGPMEKFGDDANPALAAETADYRIHQVRWPALDGVHGEGLLLTPVKPPRAFIVALPDADQTPEQIAGLATAGDGVEPFALRLVEQGCTVLVPTLVDRTARWSGRPDIRMTDQPHREWIYRQAFHMGRHVIGYEVQKTLAAVDWYKGAGGTAPVGVAGYGEGGLIAFYSAAADTRIDAVLVSGYFNSRQRVWSEPIFRNVWGLLEEFGDAEIATLIAPRALVVEHRGAPEFHSAKGDAVQIPFETAKSEFDRIDQLTGRGFQPKALVQQGAGLRAFLSFLRVPYRGAAPAAAPTDRRTSFDAAARQRRQVKELETHVQALVRESDKVRDRFFLLNLAPGFHDETWSTKRRHPTQAPDEFVKGAAWYRDYFHRELMGRFDEPLLPPSPKTRKIYDTAKWTGYEVVLDVWPEVFAWGVLLVPKGIAPGERRPVVVCQHGRQGLPKDTIEGDSAYNRFAAELASRGFITFAPHNLYRGEDRYRWLSRKANGVKASLFSFIIAQHDQTTRWLASLPFVDGDRIAFYGLSYGGETAMRVPAVVTRYCLSICSGDLNQWTRKVAATDERFSFMYTIEWEMPYFNLGSSFDYAEMAYLIFPRPFMAERGHHDRVGRDHWVAYEYARIRWLYAQFGLEDRTEIEFFQGGHAINGEGTFRFLHRRLNWPGPDRR